MRVTGFDRGANQKSKHMEVTLTLHGNERIIKHKIGLLNLAEELGNVSRACKITGLSRDTSYHYKAAVANGGVDALIDMLPVSQTSKTELMRLLTMPVR